MPTPRFTAAALLDVHERLHRGLHRLLDHLATLPDEDLVRTLPGFSYPTLVAQLHHVIAAERYWFGVLDGRIRVDDDAASYLTLDALRALRASVAEATSSFLRSASDEALSAPRSVTQFNGRTVDIVPAYLVFRILAHAYQHQGECAAMTRALGHRFPSGLDFPLL